jgi:hypothetical protein
MKKTLNMAVYFFILSTLVTPQVQAGPQDKIVLEAYNPTAVLWTVSFKGERKGCKIVGNDLATKKKQTVSVNYSDCEAIQKEYTEAEKQFKQEMPEKNQSKERFSSDEPNYAFRYSGKVFKTPFAAPKVCEANADMTLKCKATLLTSAQILLLTLLRYTGPMHLGEWPNK